MAVELCFLVTRHSPHRGDQYRVLMHLALLAAENDAVAYSVRQVALHARIPEANALKAISALREQGYLIAMTRTQRDRAGVGHLCAFIAREKLAIDPVVVTKMRKFGDQPAKRLRRVISAGLQEQIAERQRILDKLEQMAEPDKATYLARITRSKQIA